MSTQSARTARDILTDLLKAKGASKEVIRSIGHAERDSARLLATISQLSHGNITGIISMLASLGPYGVAAAVALGVGAIAYGVYQQATTPTPSEVYHWKYPT